MPGPTFYGNMRVLKLFRGVQMTSKEQQRTELHKTIWRIANDLRGSVDGWDFKSYVLGMLFYRFISENLAAYLNEQERQAASRSRTSKSFQVPARSITNGPSPPVSASSRASPSVSARSTDVRGWQRARAHSSCTRREARGEGIRILGLSVPRSVARQLSPNSLT